MLHSCSEQGVDNFLSGADDWATSLIPLTATQYAQRNRWAVEQAETSQ